MPKTTSWNWFESETTKIGLLMADWNCQGSGFWEYHASAVLSIISNSTGNTSNSGLSADQPFDLV